MEEITMKVIIQKAYDLQVERAVEELREQMRQWDHEVLYGDGSAPPRLGLLNASPVRDERLLRHVASVCGVPVEP